MPGLFLVMFVLLCGANTMITDGKAIEMFDKEFYDTHSRPWTIKLGGPVDPVVLNGLGRPDVTKAVELFLLNEISSLEGKYDEDGLSDLLFITKIMDNFFDTLRETFSAGDLLLVMSGITASHCGAYAPLTSILKTNKHITDRPLGMIIYGECVGELFTAMSVISRLREYEILKDNLCRFNRKSMLKSEFRLLASALYPFMTDETVECFYDELFRSMEGISSRKAMERCFVCKESPSSTARPSDGDHDEFKARLHTLIHPEEEQEGSSDAIVAAAAENPVLQPRSRQIKMALSCLC